MPYRPPKLLRLETTEGRPARPRDPIFGLRVETDAAQLQLAAHTPHLCVCDLVDHALQIAVNAVQGGTTAAMPRLNATEPVRVVAAHSATAMHVINVEGISHVGHHNRYMQPSMRMTP